MAHLPKVVIIGAGFGGLRAARELRKLPVEVLLVDQHNYHTFQPLLYQVATAALDPEEIGHSVRGIFQNQASFSFRLGKVTGVEWATNTLSFERGDPEHFDYLILAAGTVTNYFNIDGVEQNAFPLKSMEEATRLRSHILQQFEAADANPRLVGQGALNFRHRRRGTHRRGNGRIVDGVVQHGVAQRLPATERCQSARHPGGGVG